MVWPWEQFNWGVFWAFIAVLALRGVLRWIVAAFDRLMKYSETK